MDPIEKVLKKFRNNKNFSTIVNLVFNVVRYVLFQGDKQDFIYLGGQFIMVDEKSRRSNSSHSNTSGRFGPPLKKELNQN
jgi:hypothetical protein